MFIMSKVYFQPYNKEHIWMLKWPAYVIVTSPESESAPRPSVTSPGSQATGDRPKGAGGTSAPPRKNISACRNENRATVGTGMKVLFGQKLEVCWNQHKFINCETSLELDISKCRYLMFNSRLPYKTQQRHPQPARQRSAPLCATVHSIKCKMLRYHSCDDFVGRKIL